MTPQYTDGGGMRGGGGGDIRHVENTADTQPEMHLVNKRSRIITMKIVWAFR